MRCIEALGEWSQLHSLSETYWDQVNTNIHELCDSQWCSVLYAQLCAFDRILLTILKGQ
jgi:hypothetical protein